LFHVVDIETLAPLKIPVELEYITYKGQVRKETMMAPLLLRSTNTWIKITIHDEDFHKINLFLDKQTVPYKPRFLFVKKKFLHEVDIKKVKEISTLKSFLPKDLDFSNAFHSKYILSVLSIIQQSLSKSRKYLPLALTESPKFSARQVAHPELRSTMLYHVNAFYKILKKGKSNFLPLFVYYFANKYPSSHPYSRHIQDSKSEFVSNARLIVSFERFLLKITQK
jgi:hypothetical protein